MNLRIYALALAAVAVLPSVALAQTLLDTLAFFNALINGVVPLAISLALLVFFWGLIQYLFKIGDKTETEGKNNGLQLMIWGIAALFVMVSVWGIINILRSTFRVENNNVPVPSVPQLNPRR